MNKRRDDVCRRFERVAARILVAVVICYVGFVVAM